MSRKLNAWLGRGFRAHRIKPLLGLAVSRLAVLRVHCRSRCEHSRSDVAELLRRGHHERALLRTEYVIKEQNVLDAFEMIQSYCNIVLETAALLEHQKDCPDELKEAIAGLIFSESRCENLPELREVRAIFTSRMGKEFVDAATELRGNCGVDARLIEKLSAKTASLESRVAVTKKIAEEIGVVLHLTEQTPGKPMPPAAPSTSISAFGDAASAAEAAFQSAVYAANAALRAVELCRKESQEKGGSGDGLGGHRVPIPPTETGNEQGSRSRTPAVSNDGADLRQVCEEIEICSSIGDEDESEEEDGRGTEVAGNPTAPVHGPASHEFRRRRQFDGKIEPRRAEADLHAQRSPMSHGSEAPGPWERSPHKAHRRYSKDEDDDDEEDPAVLRGQETQIGEGSDGAGAGAGAAERRLVVRRAASSRRTRRSGF